MSFAGSVQITHINWYGTAPVALGVLLDNTNPSSNCSFPNHMFPDKRPLQVTDIVEVELVLFEHSVVISEKYRAPRTFDCKFKVVAFDGFSAATNPVSRFAQVLRLSNRCDRGSAMVIEIVKDVRFPSSLCSIPQHLSGSLSQVRLHELVSVEVVPYRHVAHVFVRGLGWRLFECEFAAVSVLPPKEHDVENALLVLCGKSLSEIEEFWKQPIANDQFSFEERSFLLNFVQNNSNHFVQ